MHSKHSRISNSQVKPRALSCSATQYRMLLYISQMYPWKFHQSSSSVSGFQVWSQAYSNTSEPEAFSRHCQIQTRSLRANSSMVSVLQIHNNSHSVHMKCYKGWGLRLGSGNNIYTFSYFCEIKATLLLLVWFHSSFSLDQGPHLRNILILKVVLL